MKLTCKLLVSIVLLQTAAWAQAPAQTPTPGPEIEVVDGKISMSALSVPLSRVISMVDRAVGLQSKVAPEVASRSISVRFKELPLKDAVQKIFEGQPFNYSLIEGKGIQVIGLAQGGTSGTSSFVDSPPVQSPINQAPFPNPTPVQPTNAVQVNPATGQPVSPANTAIPTGALVGPANSAPSAVAAPGAPVQPGQMPPPIGANPPTIPIIAQPAAGLPVTTTPAPQQPAAPGTLGGGVTPGAIPGTIK